MTKADKKIKDLCIEITIRNNNSTKKRNKELDKIKRFIKDSELFKGKTRALIKFINKMKKRKLK